ncbi:MAG: T9SS type A sorting domain-containing protein, partial [Candidatus Cloacimonetes bacterium]|nr:T9SS type A sorting domain-containing protein [Candidatus Cloacimonadota bacterium]
SDFNLQQVSPCVDAGTPDVAELNLPLLDIHGNNRIQDGDQDGTALVDIGASEYNVIVSQDDATQIKPQILSVYPNPFNPTTTISFSLDKSAYAEIKIFNLKGQLISDYSDFYENGNHHIVWQGTDQNHKRVSSGLYFVKLKSNFVTNVKKIMMLK